MRHIAAVAGLVGMVALSGAAQSSGQGQGQTQGQYQSVAPKKKPAKPVDPADVATLTGRPVPPSALAKPEAPMPEENGDGTISPAKRPPLNPADVDVLTGRADRDAAQDYRWQPQGWEALWAAEWMGERGYRRDDSFLVVPGGFGRGVRPIFIDRRFGHGLRHGFRRPFVRPIHFGRGAFFFFVQ